jgi:hypothetical protein
MAGRPGVVCRAGQAQERAESNQGESPWRPELGLKAEIKCYEHNADNPPWIKALAEVRRLAPREGWRYHHVQAIIVSIDQ